MRACVRASVHLYQLGFLDTEHLFMLHKNWLEYLQYEKVDVDIIEIYIMSTVRQSLFLLKKISIFGIPKSTVLVIIFRFFMWPLSLMNAGPISMIHLQWLEMVYQKIQDNLIN